MRKLAATIIIRFKYSKKINQFELKRQSAMPSWRLHRGLGDIICGFSSTHVDDLIDRRLGHDSSRYDLDSLMELLEKVSTHGEGAICYALLHHYLDRLVDITVKHVSERFNAFRLGLDPDFRGMVEAVRMHLEMDPKNVVSLLINRPEDLHWSLGTFYVGRGGRRRRKIAEERLGTAAVKLEDLPEPLELRSELRRDWIVLLGTFSSARILGFDDNFLPQHSCGAPYCSQHVLPREMRVLL